MIRDLIQRERRQSDPYIWGIIIFLYIVSIVEVYSAIGREIGSNVYAPIFKHTALLLFGFGITYVTSFIPLKVFKKITLVLIPTAIIILILTLFMGEVRNDARRNIMIFGFSLQGAEIAKVTIVLSMAMVLARTQIRRGVNNEGIKIVVIMVAIFSGLLIIQGLTNMILFLCISVCMMLIGGVELKKLIFIIFPIYAVLGFLGWEGKKLYEEVVSDTSIVRSDTWSNRWADFTDTTPEYEKPTTHDNLQKHRASMAMAHGGIIGVGPGNSRESSTLPLAFSDFIFAIIIEELGLIGGLVLLAAYLAILIRAGLIARRCNRAYPALLVMGMASMIVLQALFNMGIVVGVFPVSGQPLPLISQGGSSIIMMSFAFGVILSVSRYGVKESGTEIKSESEHDLPEDLQAKNPTKLT